MGYFAFVGALIGTACTALLLKLILRLFASERVAELGSLLILTALYALLVSLSLVTPYGAFKAAGMVTGVVLLWVDHVRRSPMASESGAREGA